MTPDSHPAGGQGLWGSEAEVPSFLYAMPMNGGRRVFLEETCLVAKPALPFAVLKRRLERRLEAAGVKVRPPSVEICRDPSWAQRGVKWCRHMLIDNSAAPLCTHI